MSRRQLAEIAAAVVLIMSLGLVVCFATGFMSLVTTHGTSMLPLFHGGDLALVWGVGHYHVGQIVAYWSPLLHTVVLHRIVAYRGGLYTFKGDHNAFRDPLRLPAKAIRGSLLLHVARLGLFYDWLRSPLHLVIVGASLSVLVYAATPTVRRRAGRPPYREGQAGVHPAFLFSGRLAAAMVALVIFVCLAAFAWAHPGRRLAREARAYQEQGSFSYSAPVKPSLVYPEGVVRSGQPIFLNLAHALTVRAHLRLSSPYPTSHVTGEMALTASLVSGDGWTVVLDRQRPIPLRSSQAMASVTMDLPQVTADIAAANKESGVDAAQPSLVVGASVVFHGQVDGEPVFGSYSPSVSFNVVGPELVLQGQASTASAASAAGAAGAAGASPLSQSKTGDVYVPVTRPAVIKIFGHALKIDDLRGIGSVGGVVCLLFAGLVFLLDRRRRRQGEAAQIEARYGPELVAVQSSPEDGQRTVVDVVEMASLAKLAEVYGTVILAHRQYGVHSYYVDAGSQSLYRYLPVGRANHQPRGPRERAYEPRHGAHGGRPALSGSPKGHGASMRKPSAEVHL